MVLLKAVANLLRLFCALEGEAASVAIAETRYAGEVYLSRKELPCYQ